MRGWLKYPGEPAETWIYSDETAGAVQGRYYLFLPDREDLDRAYVYLTVHPSSRRRASCPSAARLAEDTQNTGQGMAGSRPPPSGDPGREGHEVRAGH
jgi:hypothetical protein